MMYDVTVVQYGTIQIEATSEREAINKANNSPSLGVVWDNYWIPMCADLSESDDE